MKPRSPALAQVTIHASQFPDAVRRDLLHSLRAREVNHKFHYDSVKQTNRWLALHQQYSPSRNDADCVAMYDKAFAATAARLRDTNVHLVGLGCGGGQKDSRLLKLICDQQGRANYTPCDVSAAMTLVARQASMQVLPASAITPLVCDLATTEDLADVLDSLGAPTARRVVTFFGMIPNFPAGEILPHLAAALRVDDLLLLSANLAPGSDLAAGVQKILPQYDNALTREWLLTFLLDLGVERADGEMEFTIEDDPAVKECQRVTAWFGFKKARTIQLGEDQIVFKPGERVRLFFSARFTFDGIQDVLRGNGFDVFESWRTRSGEEAVFLCRRR